MGQIKNMSALIQIIWINDANNPYMRLLTPTS